MRKTEINRNLEIAMKYYTLQAFQVYKQTGGLARYQSEMENLVLNCSGKGYREAFGSPVEAKVIRLENLEEQIEATKADLLAVENTIRMIELTRFGAKKIRVIQAVYMDRSDENIKDKVHRCILNIPASKREIHNWLKECRRTFWLQRGLRL